MLGSILKGLGGLAGDAVEVVKMAGEEVVNAPGALMDGFNEGLIITPEGQETEEPKEVASNDAPKETVKDPFPQS